MVKKLSTLPKDGESQKEVKPPDDFRKRLSELPPEEGDGAPVDGVKKRHRRTKAELEAARGQEAGTFDDTGFELVAGIIKGFSDVSCRRHNIPLYNIEEFYPISQNVQKLINRYAKQYVRPEYYLMTTVAIQGSVMFLGHKKAITDAKKKAVDNPPVNRPTTGQGAKEKEGEQKTVGMSFFPNQEGVK